MVRGGRGGGVDNGPAPRPPKEENQTRHFASTMRKCNVRANCLSSLKCSPSFNLILPQVLRPAHTLTGSPCITHHVTLSSPLALHRFVSEGGSECDAAAFGNFWLTLQLGGNWRYRGRWSLLRSTHARGTECPELLLDPDASLGFHRTVQWFIRPVDEWYKHRTAVDGTPVADGGRFGHWLPLGGLRKRTFSLRPRQSTRWALEEALVLALGSP